MTTEYLREYEFESGEIVKVCCQSSDLGFGGTVWDAGLVMCAFLESQIGRSLISDCVCLELGSGTGIVTIAASVLGTKQCYASDLGLCVPFIRQNVGLNPNSTAKCLEVDWENESVLGPLADWILCADCVYDSHNVQALTQCISRLRPAKGVIVCNERREGNPAEAEKMFISEMLKNGYIGKGVHRDVIRPDWRCDDIHVVIFEQPHGLTRDSSKGA